MLFATTSKHSFTFIRTHSYFSRFILADGSCLCNVFGLSAEVRIKNYVSQRTFHRGDRFNSSDSVNCAERQCFGNGICQCGWLDDNKHWTQCRSYVIVYSLPVRNNNSSNQTKRTVAWYSHLLDYRNHCFIRLPLLAESDRWICIHSICNPGRDRSKFVYYYLFLTEKSEPL